METTLDVQSPISWTLSSHHANRAAVLYADWTPHFKSKSGIIVHARNRPVETLVGCGGGESAALS